MVNVHDFMAVPEDFRSSKRADLLAEAKIGHDAIQGVRFAIRHSPSSDLCHELTRKAMSSECSCSAIEWAEWTLDRLAMPIAFILVRELIGH